MGKGRSAPKKQGGSTLPEQVWVCIASGPSLTEADVSAVKDLNVIAINDNWRWLRQWKGDQRRVVYGCDPQWWDYHIGDIVDSGIDADLYTQDSGAAKRYNLNHIPSKAGNSLAARDAGFIHQGQNSGFQALGLAYRFGATKVILLGYDMKIAGSKRHWFGDHPQPMNRNSPYAAFIKAFNTINVPDMTIINCSRETALTCFPRMTIQEALCT